MINPFIDKVLMRLHNLIRIKGTGSPKQLARKMHCSERTARQKIGQLKDAGLPITYCKYRRTYYYTQEVRINVSLILGDKEMHKIVGGQAMQHYQNCMKTILAPNDSMVAELVEANDIN
jgi:predicted DNA-binding transcriptional regulator YafY